MNRIIFFFFVCSLVLAQNKSQFDQPIEYKAEESGYITNLTATKGGIVFSDNLHSKIYLVSENRTEVLDSSIGCGNYFSYSKEFDLLGYKVINSEGLQAPVLYSLTTKEKKFLNDYVKNCGQVSISKHGEIAYTLGDKLIIRNKEEQKEIDLGVYSNLAPISPDGDKVVFNDGSDNLWLIDINTEQRKHITTDGGYFYPKWSPDNRAIMFQKLDGNIFIYNCVSNEIKEIGVGYEPEWSGDSKHIVFNYRLLDNLQIKESEVCIYSCEDGKVTKLTESDDVYEMNPTFSIDGDEIIYHNYQNKEIIIKKISPNFNALEGEERKIVPELKIGYSSIESGIEEIKALNMPYIHQVYDTPDWHNGHWSCGPTAALTTIAYFNILPKWEGWCSSPSSGHYHYYGRYIAEKYRFRENFFELAADDPNSNSAWGGFGFMWSLGSPNSRMESYYIKHNMGAQHKTSPAYEEILSEINAGFPYSMCVMLTTSGHLIVAHGLYTERTFIFNDPYGNKNTPGYPSYDGKDVKYDWPGYNNGFQNLSGVPWGIKTRFNTIAAGDTLIDDLMFDKGFYIHTKGAANMSKWRDKNYGYNNHMWFVYSTPSKTLDTCYALWKPKIAQEGAYEVMVYIPFSNATSAIYKVYHKDGMDTVVINQKNYTSEWVSLGVFNFLANNTGYLRLGDGTGVAGQELIFDAAKFSYKGGFITDARENETVAGKYLLDNNYPNPFNPTTTINFELAGDGEVSIKIHDMLGREVMTVVEGEMKKGRNSIEINCEDLPSGVYFYSMTAGEFRAVKKMVLMK